MDWYFSDMLVTFLWLYHKIDTTKIVQVVISFCKLTNEKPIALEHTSEL